MKLSVILAFVAAATVVSAESNGYRFARGLGPRAPVKRTDSAHHPKTSKHPGGQCNTGKQYCCNHTGKCGQDEHVDKKVNEHGLAGLIDLDTLVGLNCAAGVSHCDQSSVCCDHDKSNGLIAFNCNSFNV